MNDPVKVLCNPTQSLWDRRKIFGGFLYHLPMIFAHFRR